MVDKDPSLGSEIKAIWKKNKAEMDSRKMRRKAAMEAEGTPVERAQAFLARWGKRVFYTALAAMAAYLIIVVVTLSIPLLVSIIVSTLGYTLANVGEIMLTCFCGLFFTLWCFVLSFCLVRAVWKVYVKAMRSTARRKQDEADA